MVVVHDHFNQNYKLFGLTHKVWLWLKSRFDLNLLTWTIGEIGGLETNNSWIVVLIMSCGMGLTQSLSPVLCPSNINAPSNVGYYPLLRVGCTIGHCILIAWVGVGRYVGFELCGVVGGMSP